MNSDEIIRLAVLCASCALVVCCIVFLALRPKRHMEYYESGELKHVYFLKKNTQMVKQEVFYYRNGQVNKTKKWKKGVLQGDSQVFYGTGEIYIVSHYDGGALNGPYTVYDKDGSVLESHAYKEGALV
jgi:antitoxin component YwqK of YwqJK toxin-antitoxin module